MMVQLCHDCCWIGYRARGFLLWCVSGCAVHVMRGAMLCSCEYLFAPCVQGQWRSIEDFWRDCGCPGDAGSRAAGDPPAIEPVVLLPPEPTAACIAGPGDDASPAADDGSANRLQGGNEPEPLLLHPVWLTSDASTALQCVGLKYVAPCMCRVSGPEQLSSEQHLRLLGPGAPATPAAASSAPSC
jgi:hypothetical protein